MDKNEVSVAFEILLEEIETVVNGLNAMVREGLLKSDSPRGVWEVTERGQMALAGMTSK